MTVNYQVDIISTVQDETGTNNIELYPNPAKDYINLEFSENLTSPIDFKLFNTRGKLVFQEQFTISNNIKKVYLNKLNSGIYFYSINHDNRNAKTGRLVIQ